MKKKKAFESHFTWPKNALCVQIPAHVKKGRDVQVTIERKRLKAKHRTETGEWTQVLDNELCWDINKEESMWSLVPGEHIHVSFLPVHFVLFCTVTRRSDENKWRELVSSFFCQRHFLL